MAWQLHKTDAVRWLLSQPENQFDALVTDPPYSSGGLHSGARTAGSANKKYIKKPELYPEFTGENRDQFSYLHWANLWLSEAYRTLRPGAPAMVFTDWRQYPVMSTALQMAGFTWRGTVAWDKTEACRPSKGRFRQQAEFVLWGSKGQWNTGNDHYSPGVFRCSVMDGGRKLHTTGKPIRLMEFLANVCPANGTILDPFVGSGSTGVAALLSGRRFVGIERESDYHAIATTRLKETWASLKAVP